jgi:hypothetical protein
MTTPSAEDVAALVEKLRDLDRRGWNDMDLAAVLIEQLQQALAERQKDAKEGWLRYYRAIAYAQTKGLFIPEAALASNVAGTPKADGG